MAASYFFQSLKKFSDGNGAELNAFLNQFNKCCVVGNKVDGDTPVKGQLLMLNVWGGYTRRICGLRPFLQADCGFWTRFTAV